MDVVICTCGTNIGSRLSAITYASKKIKVDYLKKKGLNNVPVDNVFIHDEYDIQFGKLLDAFDLPLSCCRTNVIARDRVLDKI
jgi:hypothetical protein